MYETIEFYNSNGCDLKEVLKSCIYKYYMTYKNSLKTSKNSKIDSTKKEKVLSNERSEKCIINIP